MANIDDALTKKIAKLARLAINDADVPKYTKDLSSILGYIAQLSEVNTENVEPLLHGVSLPEHFRDDKAVALSEAETKRIVACSEQSLYDQYKVPQVLGEA